MAALLTRSTSNGFETRLGGPEREIAGCVSSVAGTGVTLVTSDQHDGTATYRDTRYDTLGRAVQRSRPYFTGARRSGRRSGTT